MWMSPSRLATYSPHEPEPSLARLAREALVVDGELALGLHVVEHGHLLRADHRQPAHLVRVEPGQVDVRHRAAGELHVAEHHVLDAVVHVALAARADLDRRVAEQEHERRHVVHAERPERVLVASELAEVEAVGVGVQHVAELADLDHVAHAQHGRVVLEQVPDHQPQVAAPRRRRRAPARRAR